MLFCINVYGPNVDDNTFFESLCVFLDENDFLIGGDFNAVLETKLDKTELNTHIKSRKCIQTAMIIMFDLNDIIFARCLMAILCNSYDIRQVSHTYYKIRLFSSTKSLVNTVCYCTIIPGFKSDHSVVYAFYKGTMWTWLFQNK